MLLGIHLFNVKPLVLEFLYLVSKNNLLFVKVKSSVMSKNKYYVYRYLEEVFKDFKDSIKSTCSRMIGENLNEKKIGYNSNIIKKYQPSLLLHLIYTYFNLLYTRDTQVIFEKKKTL